LDSVHDGRIFLALPTKRAPSAFESLKERPGEKVVSKERSPTRRPGGVVVARVTVPYQPIERPWSPRPRARGVDGRRVRPRLRDPLGDAGGSARMALASSLSRRADSPSSAHVRGLVRPARNFAYDRPCQCRFRCPHRRALGAAGRWCRPINSRKLVNLWVVAPAAWAFFRVERASAERLRARMRPPVDLGLVTGVARALHAGHSRTVSPPTAARRRRGMRDPAFLRTLEAGALLHDAGKIGVPTPRF